MSCSPAVWGFCNLLGFVGSLRSHLFLVSSLLCSVLRVMFMCRVPYNTLRGSASCWLQLLSTHRSLIRNLFVSLLFLTSLWCSVALLSLSVLSPFATSSYSLHSESSCVSSTQGLCQEHRSKTPSIPRIYSQPDPSSIPAVFHRVWKHSA